MLAVNMLFIQCYTYAQCTAFYRTYQYGLSSDGRDIVELPDTSYIVVGQIHLSMSFPNWGGIALKLNNCGDTIWSKYISEQTIFLHNIEPYDSDKVVVFSAQRDSITFNLSTYNFLDIDSGYICCLNSFVNV
ncbi:MAG: hypothetical protein IPP29_18470 [Bacteroidetes bacterium]|nr:hypothetical protein [Bacteroidota bacterium]